MLDVAVVFAGAAVRLLKRGYRPRLSGLVGALFTAKVEGVMEKEIGWPLPQESILILEDLGTRFYICSPSMFGYGVHEQDLIVGNYTLGAVVTWADLLARSDIQIFSKPSSTSPNGRAERPPESGSGTAGWRTGSGGVVNRASGK